MKKLLLLFTFLCGANIAHCQTQQFVTISPFTQVERIEGNWVMTLPITLSYAIIHPINTTWFYGGGVGAGFNFSQKASTDLTVPVIGFFGGQFIESWPAMAIGAGLNANTGQPIFAINVNFYIFKSESNTVPGQRKVAPPQYKSLVSSDDYARTKIGFKHD